MGEKGTVWLPEGVSTLAPEIDSLFYFVYWVSVVLFLGVVFTMAYLAFRYRRRSPREIPVPVKENVLLEVAWITVPVDVSTSAAASRTSTPVIRLISCRSESAELAKSSR